MQLVLLCVGLCVWVIALYTHLRREQDNPLKSFLGWLREDANLGHRAEFNSKLAPGKTMDHLFWFVQVSDIHVNQFGHGVGAEHLEYFLRETLPIITPLFVVATGDLTDAKDSPGLGSRQHKAEWETYQKLLQRSGVYDRPNFWFDIRGNHDCFDVPGWSSTQNMFSQYSKMKSSSYSHIFKLPFGNYGLIAVDGCPEYGPSRPFNFFGALTAAKMDILEQQLNEMKAENVRHSFVISHYPIVTMQFQKTTSGKSFVELSSQITAYLSGHLHRIVAGLGREIYARQASGFLDLEVNDLKDHRIIRIAAVDHDVFSFIDVEVDATPMILISNPPNSKFLIPRHEDVRTARRSTHLRVLIFSKDEIVSNWMSIDDGPQVPLSRVSSKAPLYVAEWDPSQIGPGGHKVTVFAKDSGGQTQQVTQPFSLDGTETRIGSFGEWLCLLNFERFVKGLYWTSYLMLLFGFLIMPYLWSTYKIKCGTWSFWKYSSIRNVRSTRTSLASTHCFGFLSKWPMWALSSLWLRLCVSSQDAWTFYPFLIYTLYAPIGPLVVACLGSTDLKSSLFFSWGIWMHSFGWTRLLDTWTYSAFSMAFQVMPSYILVSLLWTGPELYWQGHKISSSSDNLHPLAIRPYHCRTWFRVLGIFWWVLCAFKCGTLVRTYGWMSLMFGFGFSWQLVFVTISIIFALRSSRMKLKKYT